ncbi:MAG: FAD:protein FMN transferase [Pseudomonadota bacterium]
MIEILRRYRYSIAVAVLLVIAVRFYSPGDIEIHEFGGATMGTTYSIKLVDLPSELTIGALSQSVTTLLRRVDQEQMSTYAAESELSRINRSPVQTPITVSAEMLEVLALAIEISELTDGAFDVTVGPLVNRWGFGPPISLDNILDGRIPTQAEIDALLARVGYRHLQLDRQNSTLMKSTDVYIDLSGIAKGYAVDKVAEYFDELGIASYFIEIGGELRIKGYKPGGQTWVPAMEKPVDTAPQVHNIFYSNGESIAVAGSGDYRNYFEANGVHYSHEIDPDTGRPVNHNLASVYVIESTAARADAMATAYMVLGAEKGFELAQRLNKAVYFVTKKVDGDGFEDRYTEKFESYLQVQ